MAVTFRSARLLTRRRFIATAMSAAGMTIARPSLSRAADRPRLTHGVQSGDVSADSAVVWARSDRPSRMLVEAATSENFSDACAVAAVDALPESDFAAKALIDDLPAGQDIFYRIRFQDLSFPTVFGEPEIGRLRTAPEDRRSISFAWSGDTAGQGWGIDLGRGGMRTYAAMMSPRPDFFIHSGDSIYADCPIPSQHKLSNGEIWRNIVTEEKSRVAQTLADFRGNYKYNLIDDNLRRFNAEVATFAQWDDHEVTNDWWPGEMRPQSEYVDKSALLLAARGRRAFHEFMPTRDEPGGRIYRKIARGPLLDIFLLDMRSHRGPNGDRRDQAVDRADLLGPSQIAWFKRALANSRATWKVIAADLPIGLISDDAIAQGNGPTRGRESEIAEILSFIMHAGVTNTIWITADMHYTAAHYYDPNRAEFQDFHPFWEFVSGPIHAGTWGPSELDNTFGPRVLYQNACSREQGENLAPCFGLQFFGHVHIDGDSEVMTVTLKDVENRDLWSTAIAPLPRPVAHRRRPSNVFRR
jgi:alkaline phosphatase D